MVGNGDYGPVGRYMMCIKTLDLLLPIYALASAAVLIAILAVRHFISIFIIKVIISEAAFRSPPARLLDCPLPALAGHSALAQALVTIDRGDFERAICLPDHAPARRGLRLARLPAPESGLDAATARGPPGPGRRKNQRVLTAAVAARTLSLVISVPMAPSARSPHTASQVFL